MFLGVLATGKPPAVAGRPGFQFRNKGWIVAAGVVVLLIAACLIVPHTRFWPFNRNAVLQDLSEASDSSVTARGFRQTYFPPGCVLEAVYFRHGNVPAPLITIEKLIIRGSYSGILRHHLDRITAVGLHVLIPAIGTGAKFHNQKSTITIGELIANGSVLEIAYHDRSKPPLRFEIHQGAIRDIAPGHPLRFDLKMHIPEPPGELETTGKFGGWSSGEPGETPLSGQYTLKQANLGRYRAISGILFSTGKFDGTLDHINVAATTDVPDFHVRSSGQKFHLVTKFDAYVDGTHGDTYLNHVDAYFGHTHVIAQGRIARAPGQKGKLTDVDLVAPKGHIEDVLGLFTSERAPMSGETAMRAKVQIPPGSEEFLKKVKLEGSFGIDAGQFTKAQTQTDVEKLSAGARGENKDEPEKVATDLSGRVSLQGGIANFSRLVFEVPGVKAQMHGTYNLINHRIDLHGPMRVDRKISDTTSGMKSFLLKMIDPIFKKKRKGEIVPVHISGTYEHPQFGLDLGENGKPQKANTSPAANKDKAR